MNIKYNTEYILLLLNSKRIHEVIIELLNKKIKKL
jgi:hypothetical protein